MTGTLPSGRAPAAGPLNRLQPQTYDAAQTGSGSQTFTTTETDSAGCTISFTTATAATCIVQGTGDFAIGTASASVVAIGRLNVDGVTVSSGREMHQRADSVGGSTCSGLWRFTVAAAGAHIVKLRLLKSGAGGVMQANDNHTQIVLTVYEVVS